MESNKTFYKSIRVESLFADTLINFGLFIRYGDKYTLYKAVGSPFTSADLDRLSNRDISELFIRHGELPFYNRYVENRLSDIMTNPQISPEIRGKIVYQASSNYIDEVFHHPNTVSEELNRCKSIIEKMIQLIMADAATIEHLSSVVSHHYYTYIHSVQVASLTLAMTTHAFSIDHDELVDVGIGALLHDLGKIFIPKKILEKPGKLDFYEWDIIQGHPALGHDYLKQYTLLSDLSLSIVLEHHEKFDGKGYPRGLSGHNIGRSASLVALADVFCALTTNRAYRNALAPAQALKIMEEEMIGSFNPDHLAILKSVMKERLLDNDIEHAA